MPKSVTLDVVQGVGDIFWIYQKLSPYFDTLNFNILAIANDDLQTRAKKFIELLPKVGTINYKIVSSEHYNKVAWTRHPIQPILDNPQTIRPYAVNKPMEDGIRIDAIDPNTEVAWDVKFRIPETKFRTDDYAVLYISGSKNNMSWDQQKWTNFVTTLYRRYQFHNLPLVLFGAKYDAHVLHAMVPALQSFKIPLSVQIDGSAQDAIRCIRDSKLFIGYQSGMNIIADNYDVPQIMMYFPYLKPMLNTWCKPGHAESKIFNGFTFDQSPDEILLGCKEVGESVSRNRLNKK